MKTPTDGKPNGIRQRVRTTVKNRRPAHTSLATNQVCFAILYVCRFCKGNFVKATKLSLNGRT
jgi:hypothetical protein